MGFRADPDTLSALAPEIAAVAEAAGEAAMAHFGTGVAVERKADDSPVTAADHAAEAIILEALLRLTPEVAAVSEEAAATGTMPGPAPVFWLVDPLDGTREFVAGRPEFTVNVALIADGAPVLGVVHAPALGSTCIGHGRTATLRDRTGESDLRVRRAASGNLTAVASRSHRSAAEDGLLRDLGVADTVSAGSSLKFCLVARGMADLYPRFGRTMEWDTAAGHAVLAAAGGQVRDGAGAPFAYGKPGYENGPFLAHGDLPPDLDARVTMALAAAAAAAS